VGGEDRPKGVDTTRSYETQTKAVRHPLRSKLQDTIFGTKAPLLAVKLIWSIKDGVEIFYPHTR